MFALLVLKKKGSKSNQTAANGNIIGLKAFSRQLGTDAFVAFSRIFTMHSHIYIYYMYICKYVCVFVPRSKCAMRGN